MQPTDLRTHNIAAILRLLSFAEKPLSRAGIAAKTGLTKPTVSKLVDELLVGGLVNEGIPTRQGRSGRPITPISIAPSTLAGVGLSISADHISLRIRGLSGTTLYESTDPSPTTTPEDAAARCAALLAPALAALPAECRIAGITVSVPGRPDVAARHLVSAPNLNWEDVNLADLIESALNNPSLPGIRLVNDARIITHTELLHRREESFLLIYGETGIGGSIVIDGAILPGTNGWAGEIGHTIVSPNGPTCRCGKQGCLEAYTSAWAMRDTAQLDASIPINELPNHIPDDMADSVGAWLGIALANMITALDLPTVVFAGYFADLFDRIEPTVRSTISSHALDIEHRTINLHPLHLRENATLVGASLDALSPVFDDPTPWI